MPGKKFRFSLQKVLELRRHETERARQALADAERALEQKQEQLKQARQRLAKCQRVVEEGTALCSADLQQAGAYREDARQSVTEARAAVEEAQQRVEEARTELQEARQAEEAFEELRDQEKGKFDREQTKAEIAFFDEQAVLRHARGNRSSLMQGL
jgi:flagellar FliJ protein